MSSAFVTSLLMLIKCLRTATMSSIVIIVSDKAVSLLSFLFNLYLPTLPKSYFLGLKKDH